MHSRKMRGMLARRALLGTAVVLSACAAPSAVAQPQKPTAADSGPLVKAEIKDDGDFVRALRENYTKHEFKIRMRDGVRLHTHVYAPKDTARTYPILMMRTPYGVAPYGIDNYPNDKNPRALRRFVPSVELFREGYIFVHQDVRGRMASEGTFVDVRPVAAKKGEIDETTDAYDTIDWLVKNVPNNNGNVGAWGISYPGFYAAMAAISGHPALKAVSPQAPVTDWFAGDDVHHNGAFFLAGFFDFERGFGKPRPAPTTKATAWETDHHGVDEYEFFLDLGPLANVTKRYYERETSYWDEIVAHGSLDDFWKARNPRPHYKNVKPAVLTVGGLFDAENLFGAVETYRAFEQQSPGANNTLVLGPWSHGGWSRTEGDRLADVSFGQKTSPFYRANIEFPFFQRHLKGKTLPKEPEAWVFETGTNVWQRHAAWPPANAKKATWYLQPDGKLGVAAPPAPTAGDEGTDVYVSDPNKPVPYREGTATSTNEDYMAEDQRFASRRPDVVVHQTEALEGDVSLAGPLEASLWVSTTGTDADFVVKLVDVYPGDVESAGPTAVGKMGGYQQLVRAEIMRGKFRNSLEKPAPFIPGEPTRVLFTLPDVSHTFRAGHRIMVQIQSSWFPLVDRNPQTFTDIYRATAKDFRVATHRIYRTPDRPTGLTVRVVRGELPGVAGAAGAR